MSAARRNGIGLPDGREHECEYVMKTRWHPARGGGFVQTIEGYRCRWCGRPKPMDLSPAANVKAALRYLQARYRDRPWSSWRS